MWRHFSLSSLYPCEVKSPTKQHSTMKHNTIITETGLFLYAPFYIFVSGIRPNNYKKGTEGSGSGNQLWFKIGGWWPQWTTIRHLLATEVCRQKLRCVHMTVLSQSWSNCENHAAILVTKDELSVAFIIIITVLIHILQSLVHSHIKLLYKEKLIITWLSKTYCSKCRPNKLW